MSNTNLPKLAVSVPETCDLTGLGETTIWKLIREGELKVVRIGRRTLVPVSEIEALLNSRRQAG